MLTFVVAWSKKKNVLLSQNLYYKCWTRSTSMLLFRWQHSSPPYRKRSALYKHIGSPISLFWKVTQKTTFFTQKTTKSKSEHLHILIACNSMGLSPLIIDGFWIIVYTVTSTITLLLYLLQTYNSLTDLSSNTIIKSAAYFFLWFTRFD